MDVATPSRPVADRRDGLSVAEVPRMAIVAVARQRTMRPEAVRRSDLLDAARLAPRQIDTELLGRPEDV
ncbi:hypothetical protein ACFSKW_48425, partial [Nonomuraea mangrovi]